MEVVQLFRQWMAVPSYVCRCRSHQDDKGNPLPEEEVCHREKTWRYYMIARDRYIEQYKEKNPGLKGPNLGVIFEAV